MYIYFLKDVLLLKSKFPKGYKCMPSIKPKRQKKKNEKLEGGLGRHGSTASVGFLRKYAGRGEEAPKNTVVY